jgi:hypothetical protein
MAVATNDRCVRLSAATLRAVGEWRVLRDAHKHAQAWWLAMAGEGMGTRFAAHLSYLVLLAENAAAAKVANALDYDVSVAELEVAS